MRILQQLLPKLSHESDHVVILLSFLIHIDREVRLVGSQIHFLGIFEDVFRLELAGLLDVEHSVLGFGEVTGNHLVGLVPFVGADVHLESVHVLASLDVVFLS